MSKSTRTVSDTDVVVQVFGCQVLEPEEIRRLLAGIAGELGEIYVKSKNSSS